MFQHIVPALLHLFIYVAFLFTSTELIEIIADGTSGSHRFFMNKLGWIYVLLISTIEVLSVLAFISTLYFLARRNLLQVPRFKMSEMTGMSSQKDKDRKTTTYGDIATVSYTHIRANETIRYRV